MKFDLAKTLSLVRGGLTDHENTWRTYFENTPVWQETAIILTVPLLLANVLLSMVFSRLSGGFSYAPPGQGFLSALLMLLVLAVAGVAVSVFVFNYLAGVFAGKPDLSRAFAAVTFAMMPAWLAGIIGALIPGIGFLISLAGGIVALVFLYKIMPLALDVPQHKRVVHFIASIVLIIVVQMIIGTVFGVSNMNRSNLDNFRSSNTASTPAAGVGSGFIGELERQGRLMETAQSDVFEPPKSGELKRDQVQRYIGFIRKSQHLQEEYANEMQELTAKVEREQKEGKTPSVADMGRLYSGVGSAVGMNNAEMEIVVTGGGNWAEHQWVREQLRIAQIQQGEGPDPIEHNYQLYLEFQEELRE